MSRLRSRDPRSIADKRNLFDILIIGSGIVGSALAYSLASTGRRVLIIERDLCEPDRIVGELLQPGGCAALSRMGLLDCLDGIDARLCQGYQIFWGSKSVDIPYPEINSTSRLAFSESGLSGQDMPKSSNGKAQGRSFHHGRFVQALRKKAASHKNVTLVEGTVSDLVYDDESVVIGINVIPSQKAIYDNDQPTITAKGVLTLYASLTLVVDGFASKFRKALLPSDARPPVVRSNFVALLLKDADLPATNHGHVILKDASATSPSANENTTGGPVLVYQLSKHDTRMLVDVPGQKLPSISNGDLKRHLEIHVLPSLPPKLVPSFRAALNSTTQEGRLRSMPNSFLPAYPQHRSSYSRGCLLVGDALNMRHPLTGGGMTVGLGDALILTELLGGSEGLGASSREVIDLEKDRVSVREAAEVWYWRRKGLTGTINVLAQALYSLFGADGEDLELLKMACFRYFERGGKCIEDPVSMLAGLRPSPSLLFYHFFSVAFYAIYLIFTHPIPGTKGSPSFVEVPHLFYRSFSIIWTACVVFLPVIYSELRF